MRHLLLSFKKLLHSTSPEKEHKNVTAGQQLYIIFINKRIARGNSFTSECTVASRFLLPVNNMVNECLEFRACRICLGSDSLLLTTICVGGVHSPRHVACTLILHSLSPRTQPALKSKERQNKMLSINDKSC